MLKKLKLLSSLNYTISCFSGPAVENKSKTHHNSGTLTSKQRENASAPYKVDDLIFSENIVSKTICRRTKTYSRKWKLHIDRRKYTIQ